MTPPRLLRILHAGSLDRLVRDDLIPLFERRARCSCESLSGSSRALARAIRDGSAHADVFLSADAEVIQAELSGTAHPSLVDACVVFATNAMVVALSDAGPHAALVRNALAGEIGLVELLQAGLRIGRPDPDEDPKGYRTLFALHLLERHAGPPGLASRLLGPPRNPDQIFPVPALIPMLRRGEIELLVTYRSQAVEEAREQRSRDALGLARLAEGAPPCLAQQVAWCRRDGGLGDCRSNKRGSPVNADPGGATRGGLPRRSPRLISAPARGPGCARGRSAGTGSAQRADPCGPRPLRAVAVHSISSVPRAWLPQPSSSPTNCRRRTRLFQYGGPRPGERRGSSVASPTAGAAR